jgi:hypothetical protein
MSMNAKLDAMLGALGFTRCEMKHVLCVVVGEQWPHHRHAHGWLDRHRSTDGGHQQLEAWDDGSLPHERSG